MDSQTVNAQRQRAAAWRTEEPDPGLIAWVWVNVTEVLAVWTGKAWMTLDSRQVLRDVTHWRAR